MKILFMVDYWKPVATANAICAQNVITELQKNGHEIFVSAYRHANYNTEVENDIHINYVTPSFARRILNQSKYTNNLFIKKTLSFIGKSINRIRRILLLPFYPIVSFTFSRRWSKQIIKIVTQNNIDAVVSVIAPDDSFYVGYKVKRACPKIMWIPYFIDNGSNVLPGTSFEFLKIVLKEKAVRWEDNLLSYAQGIIIMKGHEEHYRKSLSKKNLDKLFISNVPLFLNLEPEFIHKNSTEIWMYAGSLSGQYYNPESIVDFFKEYIKSHDAQLHLFGSTDKDKFLNDESQSSNGKILWHGLVKHSELYQYYKKADVLIYFKNGVLDSVSGKFFEYLKYKKPIIYLGNENDINAQLVKMYSKGVVVSTPVDNSKIYLLPDVIGSLKTKKINDNEIYEKFKTSTPIYTANIIDTILK